MLLVVDLPAGSLVPVHTHDPEQAGLVLEEQFEFIIGGKRKLLNPGDMYIIPSNVEHSISSISVASKVLDIYSPPREELKQ